MKLRVDHCWRPVSVWCDVPVSGPARKRQWEQFAEEVGIKPRLVLTRVADMVKKIQDSRLQLFRGAFAPYACDALYRLMELMGEQAEKTLRRLT
jgi:hypothetical protein